MVRGGDLNVYANYAKVYVCGNAASEDISLFKEQSYRMELPTYLHTNNTKYVPRIFQ